MRIAIIGGGISGLTAAYELARLAREGAEVEATVYEASRRLGGLIETVHEGGFTIECGPDAWVSAKPWAAELATELDLADELLPSNDAARRTWLFFDGRLVPMPDGMNLMVPTNLEALKGSPIFTSAAIAAYGGETLRAAELLASIPQEDESVASFTLRHFGWEVLDRIAAPLLSGIFGGDVHSLSARATLPGLIEMERTHGSLVAALAQRQDGRGASVFTTLRSGLGTLIERLAGAIPAQWFRLNTSVTAIRKSDERSGWFVSTSNSCTEFDAVFLAAPVDACRRLLAPLQPLAAELLPSESSSAVLVAFCFADAARVPLPPGFGFLVAPQSGEDNGSTAANDRKNLLLACTFVDQKFADRVPPGGRLLRAFFGGKAAERLARCNNDEIAAIARLELARILHADAPSALPTPIVTVIRRWPSSLPQYAVGHLDRTARFDAAMEELPGITLLGNSLHGVGLPDLIRDARKAARAVVGET